MPDYELKPVEQSVSFSAEEVISEALPIPEEAPPWEEASMPPEEKVLDSAASNPITKKHIDKKEKANVPYVEATKKPIGSYRLIKGGNGQRLCCYLG